MLVGLALPAAGAAEVAVLEGVIEGLVAGLAVGLVGFTVVEGFAVAGVVALGGVAAGLVVVCCARTGMVSSHKPRIPVGKQVRERSLIEEEEELSKGKK